jgi:hypothetical protein
LDLSAKTYAGVTALWGRGSLYNEGTFCGAQIVCIVNADIVLTGGAHTVTRGLVVISTLPEIPEEVQAEEYQHSIDQLGRGLLTYDLEYAENSWNAWLDGGDPYDDNPMEIWAKGQAARWMRSDGDWSIFDLDYDTWYDAGGR